ncbi:AraC family transcriptional regulator [Microcoleus sp. herbarium19]|uniref:AraC family transcriptional regulator n=1 Tax=unclassified Microcoleus TaxID=2642155 RepID=UPI002FD320B0
MITDLNKTKFWRISQLDNLEILHATDVLVSSPRHTHESLTFGVVDRGSALLNCKGQLHPIREDCVIVINPDDVHACHTDTPGGYSQRMMYLSVALLEQITYEITGRSQLLPLFKEVVLQDQKMARQAKLLFQSLTTSMFTLKQETQLLSTLVALVQAHAEIPSLKRQWRNTAPLAVCQVKEYLQANYAENPSLNQLSALTHLSPFHLSLIFSHTVGLPPHLYLIQVRVSHAKKLLAQGMAIAQVAQEVGFAHQSHLNRHFKRVMGITPKQYQNSKNVQD